MLDSTSVEQLLDWSTAIGALREHLRREGGSDVFPRTAFPCRSGELLLMPAETSAYVGVKVISLNRDAPPGVPRAQGVYTLFDARTLSPVAQLDAVSLTAIRTAAVSALAVDLLATPEAARLVVFGTGPQAVGHARAIAAVRELSSVAIVGRRQEAVADACAQLADLSAHPGSADALEDADIVACCTASAEPLFDSAALRPDAMVVAIGSHHPDRREVDSDLVRDSFVVVESRENALREAGDIVLAGEDPASLIDATLTDLVGGQQVPAGRRFFKSVGEGWEDLVLAAAAFESTAPDRVSR